jgi:hypothetical protein
MAKDQSDILKEILKNSKNPKAIEQAQAGLDEAKQARKAEIASQMKGSLSSTIAKSTGPVNESTKDSDNIKAVLKESKEQNTNLVKLIRLNEKSIEDNSELFGRLEKTMNAIVDALQEQKRQQSQTTSQTAPSNVSVPSVGPAVPPPSGGGGGFNLMDLIPDFFGNKNKTPAPEGTPKGNTGGGIGNLLQGFLKTGAGIVGGGLAGGAAYGMMSPEQQEKAKALLGENADTVMSAGGAAAGGVLSNLGTAGRVLSTVASGPMLLPAAVGAGVVGLAAHRAAAQKADPLGAENFDRTTASGAKRAAIIQGPEADKNAPNANADISQKKLSPPDFLMREGIIKLPSEAKNVIASIKGDIVTLKDGRYFDNKEQILRNPEEKPKVEPTVSDKDALEKKMNEPQDTFSKGSSKEAIEKRMNEPQDTFSIGAVNYAKQKFDEAVPEFNRGTSGSLEAQNLPENVMKLMKEKGISYNEANKILRSEIEAKDPNAFMMATNAISAKSNMELKSTNRDEDYSSAVETPTYDAMGNYSGPDIKTEYEKAGKRIERKSSEGIVSNKSSFGSEFLGGLLSKQGLQTGSFMGNTMKEKQGTNVEGVEDEKSMDIAHILGIRKSGGIFGTDEYDVHYGKDSLKVSKSEYMRMQQYVADGDPEKAMALFNELNKKNKKDIEASPIFKAQQEQMNEAVKQGDYKTAMNVAMNRTENDFPTPTNETPIPVVEQGKVEATGKVGEVTPTTDNPLGLKNQFGGPGGASKEEVEAAGQKQADIKNQRLEPISFNPAAREERLKEIADDNNRPIISNLQKEQQKSINEGTEQPKSTASKWIQDLAAKHRVNPDDLEFGMNHPNIDVKADIAAGKAGVDTPEGIKAAMNAKNIESTGPNGEKLSKLEQSGQAQNQAPIVLKGGDTVNNVVTNNNTSSGGSGGGAGSPSRIPSPFDRIVMPNLWSYTN